MTSHQRRSKVVDKFFVAGRGLLVSIKEDFSVKVQVTLAVLSIIFFAFLRISYADWVIVIMVIGLVITTELLNSSIERLSNLVDNTHNHHIMLVKDVAAGAVLVASLTALAVGILLVIKYGGLGNG